MPLENIQASRPRQFYSIATAAPTTAPQAATTLTSSAQAGENVGQMPRQLAPKQRSVLVFDSRASELGAATSNYHSLRWASPAWQEELKDAVPPAGTHQQDHVWKTLTDAASAPTAGAGNADVPISEELQKFREQISKIPISFEHTINGTYNEQNVPSGGHYAGHKNRVRIVEFVGDPLPSGLYEAKVQLKREGKEWADKTAHEGINTMFPVEWKPRDIKRKVQDAYDRFCKTAPFNAVRWEECTSEGIVIRGTIEIGRGTGRVSAFPVFKPSRQAGKFGYDPSVSDIANRR